MPYTLVSNALRHLGRLLAEWHGEPTPTLPVDTPRDSNVFIVHTTTTPDASQRGTAPVPITAHCGLLSPKGHSKAGLNSCREASSSTYVSSAQQLRASHRSVVIQRDATKSGPEEAHAVKTKDAVLDKPFRAEEKLVWVYRQLQRGIVDVDGALSMLRTLRTRHEQGVQTTTKPFEASFNLLRALLLLEATNKEISGNPSVRHGLCSVVPRPLLLAVCHSLLTSTNPTPTTNTEPSVHGSTFLVEFFGHERVVDASNVAVSLLVASLDQRAKEAMNSDEAVKVLKLFGATVGWMTFREVLNPALCLQLLEACATASPSDYADACVACASIVGHSLPDLCKVALLLSEKQPAAAAAMVQTNAALHTVVSELVTRHDDDECLGGFVSMEERRRVETELRRAFVVGCVYLNDIDAAIRAVPRRDVGGVLGSLVSALLSIHYIEDACRVVLACDEAAIRYVPHTIMSRLREEIRSYSPPTAKAGTNPTTAARLAALWDEVSLRVGARPQQFGSHVRKDALDVLLASGDWKRGLSVASSRADRRRVEDYMISALKLPLAPPSLVKACAPDLIARWALVTSAKGATSAHSNHAGTARPTWVDALQQLASASPPAPLQMWVMHKMADYSLRSEPNAEGYRRAHSLLLGYKDPSEIPHLLYKMAPSATTARELFARAPWDAALATLIPSRLRDNHSGVAGAAPPGEYLLKAVTAQTRPSKNLLPSRAYIMINTTAKGRRRTPSSQQHTFSVGLRPPCTPPHTVACAVVSEPSWEAALASLTDSAGVRRTVVDTCCSLGSTPKLQVGVVWNAVVSAFGSVPPEALDEWLSACGSRGNTLAGQALLERAFVVRLVPKPKAVADLLLLHPSGSRRPAPLTAALLPTLTLCGRFDNKPLCVGLLHELLCNPVPGTATAPALGWLAVLATGGDAIPDDVACEVKERLLVGLDQSMVSAILRFANHTHRMQGEPFAASLDPVVASQMCRAAAAAGMGGFAAATMASISPQPPHLDAVFVGPRDRKSCCRPVGAYPHHFASQRSTLDQMGTEASQAALSFLYRRRVFEDWSTALSLCGPLLQQSLYTFNMAGPHRTVKGPLSLGGRYTMTAKLIEVMCAGGAPTEVLCAALDGMGVATLLPKSPTSSRGVPVRLSSGAMLAVSARLCGAGHWSQAIQVLRLPKKETRKHLKVVAPRAVRMRQARIGLVARTAQIAAIQRHFHLHPAPASSPAHQANMDTLVRESTQIAVAASAWHARAEGGKRRLKRPSWRRVAWRGSRPRLVGTHTRRVLKASYGLEGNPQQSSFTFFEKLLARHPV